MITIKILTLYYSKSGNTRKIAEAIHNVAQINHDASIKSIKEINGSELENYNLVFLGAACHHSTLAKVMLSYINTISEKPTFKLAGFYTHSTVMADGTERNDYLFNEWAGLSEKVFKKLALERKIELLGLFHCQGSASFLIEKFIRLKIINDKDEWVPYRKEMRLHPTSRDLADAKKFAEMIIKKGAVKK